MYGRETLALATFLATVPAFAADEIALGTSLPLSGPLAGLGHHPKWEYETAVGDIASHHPLRDSGAPYRWAMTAGASPRPIVDQDMGPAVALADYIHVSEHGRIALSGNTEVARRDALLRHQYIDTAN